jgi:hypothetical protein
LCSQGRSFYLDLSLTSAWPALARPGKPYGQRTSVGDDLIAQRCGAERKS